MHKLDATANESEVVKILTFAPRCLVAKSGWIACGGENGEFVAFAVHEGGETTDNDPPRGEIDATLSHLRSYIENGGSRNHIIETFGDLLSPDDRRQLGLDRDSDPSSSADRSDPSSDTSPPLFPGITRLGLLQSISNTKPLVAKSKSFGKERVNCITLWFPPTTTSANKVTPWSGAYSQPVAVLANNDKKVTIVNLEHQDAVDEVACSDCVNRALISPNGQLLVAICDDPYLYVHERIPKAGVKPSLCRRRDVQDYEWRQCAKVHLASQTRNDRSDQRGSFAACFSNTGRYLAVGTQYGMISVFDTAALLEPGLDPLVATFTSSRPKEDVGAIRDMAFCPGPYDLLAWTEHRGRVGIVDIRSNYVSRQMLDLGDYDDYEQIMVTERGSIDPRLLQRNSRGDLALADSSSTPPPPTTTTTTMAEGTANRRPNRRYGGSEYHSPLSPEETSVLEALAEYRRRRDQGFVRNNLSPGPGSMRLLDRMQNRALAAQARDAAIAATSSSSTAAQGNRGDAAAAALSRDHRNNNSRVSDILSEINEQRESLRAHVEQMRQLSERSRARRRLLEPSREVAAAVTAVEAAAAAATTTTRTTPAQPPITRPNRPQTDLRGTDTTQNTFEAYVLAADLAHFRGDMAGDNSDRPLDRAHSASVWNTMVRHRDETEPASARLARVRAQMNMVGRVDREHDDTAGLAWSDDGSVL